MTTGFRFLDAMDDADFSALLGPSWREMSPRGCPPYASGEVADEMADGDRHDTETTTPTWPDPPNQVIYSGLAGEITDAIAPHSEADPVAILVQILSMTGNAIGRGPFYRVEDDQHRGNLFVALVGASGSGRKGTSARRARNIVGAADPEWAANHVVSGLSSGEGLIWAVRDPIHRSTPIKEKGRVIDYQEVIEDPGITDKRLLVFESELASTLRVMQRDGSTLSAVVRQAWDGGKLRSLTKNSPATATDPHISIIGHITADELRRYLDRTELGNGFANRFLFLCVRRAQYLPDGGVVDDQVMIPLANRLRTMIERARQAGEVYRDAKARELWADIYPALSDARVGLLGAVTSRAEAQVLRLSLLYALLDGDRVIGRQHIEAALALWQYAEASARFVFGESVGDPVTDRIVSALRAAGSPGLTRTGIRDLFQKHETAGRLDRALVAIEAAGLARRERVQTAGRPMECWVATKATEATKGGESGLSSLSSLLSHCEGPNNGAGLGGSEAHLDPDEVAREGQRTGL